MGDAETVLLTGMSWSDGSPALRVRRNGAPSVLEPLVGFTLRYSTSPNAARRCIGHKPFRETTKSWVDCDRQPLHEGRTCDRCAASDATFASQLHHAHNKGPSELDSAVRAHLEQPNHLYLAAFRDGSVKVGTSTAPRVSTRLDEQGAWIAKIVAKASDGFAVRTLEDRVTVELGLPQSVSVARKLDGLLRPKPLAQLQTELGQWAKNVTQLIERSSDARVQSSAEPWEFSGNDDPLFEGLHPYPLKLDSGNHDLEFLGASGRLTVAQRPGASDRFVVDVRKLYGIDLSLDDVIPDELAVQDSLF